MGVSIIHLFIDGLDDLLDIEMAFLLADLGDKDDMKEEVPKFLFHCSVILSIYSLYNSYTSSKRKVLNSTTVCLLSHGQPFSPLSVSMSLTSLENPSILFIPL
jgi:hypothetical protein